MALAFAVPEVAENLEGWGPGPASVPSQLEHVPYAPFSKADRVGRASDWTAQAFKYASGRYDRNNTGGNAVFNFFSNEDEVSTIIAFLPTHLLSSFWSLLLGGKNELVISVFHKPIFSL
jgi:hypothetical protein